LGGNLSAYLYRIKTEDPDGYLLIRNVVRQVAPFFSDFILEPFGSDSNMIRLKWKHRGFDGISDSDSGFDVSSLSDGTLRFIALATLFGQSPKMRPDLILVDEPELGLHPYAIELLASLIKQSPLLLDYFEPEDVLVADRVQGATEIRRLESAPLAEWLKDYSLGQLWEKGELEGRPGKE
jgi:predicted ATPase